ncbi:hypothetical protein OG936_31870 [Streptomyces sp. NBC_00846]|uniref:hypothetical protein n=1 Tax=Streptomyces sp. NBC_00846 TaxID=2975849 RepID=UPI0038648470|nr:hypothetical protein OG936_31870 [Streptomyces sp. NBC_00846]
MRLVFATTLAASGYIHAQLYIDGYRIIHVNGPLFLLQAGVAFAVATAVPRRDQPSATRPLHLCTSAPDR